VGSEYPEKTRIVISKEPSDKEDGKYIAIKALCDY
jgi:hypothetical protein